MYRGTTPMFKVNITTPDNIEILNSYIYQVRVVLSQGAATQEIHTFPPRTTPETQTSSFTGVWKLTEDIVNNFEANLPLRFQARAWIKSKTTDAETVLASDAIEIPVDYIADVIKHEEWGPGNQ